MLSTIFAYISSRFYSLAYRFDYIADWLIDQGWPWHYLAPPFQTLYTIGGAIGSFFYDAYLVTCSIETILDDAWSKAKQVFDYVYDVLKDKVNDALSAAWDAWDYAVIAFNKARDAWDYATDWLTDRANEAWSRAGNVWGGVTDWLKQYVLIAIERVYWVYDQIQAAVIAKTQEIYAWVKSIPAEISDYVAGVIADIGAVTTEIVQTLIGIALYSIRAPFNLITMWFDEIQDFFNSPLDWLVSKFANWFFVKDWFDDPRR